MTSALLVVDVQNDFVSGALAVPDAGGLVHQLCETLPAIGADVLLVATMDWHPPNHSSFKTFGGPWPPHCVRDTWGAELADGLALPTRARVVRKGTMPALPGYSAFEQTQLAEMLKRAGVTKVFVTGLATDYCVKATALGSIAVGFRTTVVEDLTRAVSGSNKKTFDELRAQGVNVAGLRTIMEDLMT